jgi:shikimate dehydrogenase
VGAVRILGGGATAQSMLLVARQLGATDVEVAVRSPEKARFSGVAVRQLSERPGRTDDLLISTLPADALAARAAEWAGSATAVFDVSYHPWPTPLASAADAGQPVVTGIDLLAHQAALQVELMTGEAVDPALLREAVLPA